MDQQGPKMFENLEYWYGQGWQGRTRSTYDAPAAKPKMLDVKQFRYKLLDTAKAIAARGELTPTERKDYDGLMKKFDRVSAYIRSMEEEREMEFSEAEKNGTIVYEGPEVKSESANNGQVLALRSGEKYATRFQKSRSNLGGIVRGMILGDPKGFDPEEVRAMAIAGSLGYTVPDSISANIIDLARNKSALFKSGAALLVPMATESVTIPQLLSGPNAEWHVENQPLTGGDMTFGALYLRAKTIACTTTMSVELVEDSIDALGAFIEMAIAEALAAEIDRAGVNGSGANGEFCGILNTAGISPYEITTAAFPSYDQLIEMSGKLDGTNAVGPYTCIMNPAISTKLNLAKDSNDDYLKTIPFAAQQLNRIVSNQIPTGITAGGSSKTSPIIMVGKDSCVFGIRSGLVLQASRTAGDSFKNMQVTLRAHWRGDFNVLRRNHVTYSTGVKYE